jgi:cell wall-associated NlpC family hydrolase
MSQSDKEKGFSDRYSDKLSFLQDWYKERTTFLSTFKLPGLTLQDLEDEIKKLQDGGNSSSDSSAAGQISGNGPEEQTWNYFASLGFTPAAIAGVMGNLKQESGINPNSVQGDFDGAGYGIAQWDNRKSGKGRWNQLENFAKGQGKSPTDLGVQLAWLWQEMQARSSLKDYPKMTDVTAATTLFEEKFEAAGKPLMSKRIQFAQEYYDKWAKTPPSGVSSAKGDAGKVMSEAESWLSKPNVYWFGGGRSQGDIAAGKFDCSSWVRYVFAQCGYDIMNNGGALGGNTQTVLNNPNLIKVDSSNMQPGDMVFWNTYQHYGHIGIYLGNNRAIGDNGDNGTGHVSYIDMNNSYYKPRLEPQARRVKWNA